MRKRKPFVSEIVVPPKELEVIRDNQPFSWKCRCEQEITANSQGEMALSIDAHRERCSLERED